jgi:uncharacterized protein (DUF1697 family)
MAQLRELLGSLGYEDVKTYIQSGNVVFTGADDPPVEVEKKLAGEIEKAFGFDVSVIVRSRDEIAAVIESNPLGEVADNPSRHHVIFYATPIDQSRVADLDRADFAPETFHIDGREAYMWTPDGMRDSKLAKTLTEKRLGGIGTARNWRTVEKLLALADGH